MSSGGRVPYSDEAWGAAPIGSSLVTDLVSGERWIEPPPAAGPLTRQQVLDIYGVTETDIATIDNGYRAARDAAGAEIARFRARLR